MFTTKTIVLLSIVFCSWAGLSLVSSNPVPTIISNEPTHPNWPSCEDNEQDKTESDFIKELHLTGTEFLSIISLVSKEAESQVTSRPFSNLHQVKNQLRNCLPGLNVDMTDMDFSNKNTRHQIYKEMLFNLTRITLLIKKLNHAIESSNSHITLEPLIRTPVYNFFVFSLTKQLYCPLSRLMNHSFTHRRRRTEERSLHVIDRQIPWEECGWPTEFTALRIFRSHELIVLESLHSVVKQMLTNLKSIKLHINEY